MTSFTFDALASHADPAKPLHTRVTLSIEGDGATCAFGDRDPDTPDGMSVEAPPVVMVNGALAAVDHATWARFETNGTSVVALVLSYTAADGDAGVLVLQADGPPLAITTQPELLDFLTQSSLSPLTSGPWAMGPDGAVPLDAFLSYRSQSQSDTVAFNSYVPTNIGDLPPVSFNAGQGNDKITGTAWYDSFLGGEGHDLIQLGDNPGDPGANLPDPASGGWWDALGPDQFNWDDRAFGGAGNDTITAGTGNAWMEGGAGNDVLTGGTGRSSTGTPYRLTALGGDGKDRLTAAAAGSSTLDGGAGNDTLSAETSFTTLKQHGLRPDGTIRLIGGTGNDLLSGSINQLDTLAGGEGNDTLRALDGGDALLGEGGHDWIEGGTGNDTATGGTGNDQIFGQTGNDWLYGDDGADLLSGGDGIDRLEAGTGNDTLQGGAGADAFSFLPGMNHDVVTDFSLAEADSLRLSRALTGTCKTATDVLTRFATVTDGHTVLNFGAGNTLTLQGITDLSDLSTHIILI